MSKVIKVTSEGITFDDGAMIYSEHFRDCSEEHYLNFDDLELPDFDGLEFDLECNFFERIEGYGIELLPLNGHPIRIAGHGYNNGYYSDELTLVVCRDGEYSVYGITECQDIVG